jgi:hypothetical protein
MRALNAGTALAPLPGPTPTLEILRARIFRASPPPPPPPPRPLILQPPTRLRLCPLRFFTIHKNDERV